MVEKLYDEGIAEGVYEKGKQSFETKGIFVSFAI